MAISDFVMGNFWNSAGTLTESVKSTACWLAMSKINHNKTSFRFSGTTLLDFGGMCFGVRTLPQFLSWQ